jgi:hypothetical protein
MTLSESLVEVWRQALVEDLPAVELNGRSFKVGRTRGKGLRTVSFSYEDFVLDGIEQNPEKESRWAKLAQEGKRIMQFSCNRRYVANVCEGQILRYPAWKAQGLPD